VLTRVDMKEISLKGRLLYDRKIPHGKKVQWDFSPIINRDPHGLNSRVSK
jgi:hypothetical protein